MEHFWNEYLVHAVTRVEALKPTLANASEIQNSVDVYVRGKIHLPKQCLQAFMESKIQKCYTKMVELHPRTPTLHGEIFYKRLESIKPLLFIGAILFSRNNDVFTYIKSRINTMTEETQEITVNSLTFHWNDIIFLSVYLQTLIEQHTGKFSLATMDSQVSLQSTLTHLSKTIKERYAIEYSLAVSSSESLTQCLLAMSSPDDPKLRANCLSLAAELSFMSDVKKYASYSPHVTNFVGWLIKDMIKEREDEHLWQIIVSIVNSELTLRCNISINEFRVNAYIYRAILQILSVGHPVDTSTFAKAYAILAPTYKGKRFADVTQTMSVSLWDYTQIEVNEMEDERIRLEEMYRTLHGLHPYVSLPHTIELLARKLVDSKQSLFLVFCGEVFHKSLCKALLGMEKLYHGEVRFAHYIDEFKPSRYVGVANAVSKPHLTITDEYLVNFGSFPLIPSTLVVSRRTTKGLFFPRKVYGDFFPTPIEDAVLLKTIHDIACSRELKRPRKMG